MSEERKRGGLAWPAGLAGALLVVLAVNGVLVYSAVGDPSFVVEADYHRRAVAFDAEAARGRASRALGWRAEVEVAAGGACVVRLRDAAGAPLEGAEVSVRAFHNARAGRVLAASGTPLGGGAYSVAIAPDRHGIWVFEVEATRGADRFAAEVRLEIESSTAALEVSSGGRP